MMTRMASHDDASDDHENRIENTQNSASFQILTAMLVGVLHSDWTRIQASRMSPEPHSAR